MFSISSGLYIDKEISKEGLKTTEKVKLSQIHS